jgi:hypothetical protein
MRGGTTGGRLVVLAGLALLGACSRKDEAPKVADGAEHVACALGQGAAFAMNCAVERSRAGDEQVLVVRHPDGGFRRLSVRQDGTGLAATDGADNARVTVAGKVLEVAIGEDRYRIPFAVKANARD